LADPRLDLRDLYVFQSPADPSRTVLALTVNSDGGALYPKAVYRLGIDQSGDYRDDISFSFVFSEPEDGRQSVDVLLAVGSEASSIAAVGSLIFGDIDVSFADAPHVWRSRSGSFVFFAGARSDPSRTAANVVAMVIEVPTGNLGAQPDVRIWARCSLLENGTWRQVDRVGHPGLAESFVDGDDMADYRAGAPGRDRERWIGSLIEVMARDGGYSREEAIAAIDAEGTLPDVLTFNPSKPAKYPNGRTLTDDVIAHRIAFLAKGKRTPSGVNPHTDLLSEFPYLGPPH
jgi:hypothetical protein